MDLAEVEAAIGIPFTNRELLVRALTHSSHRGEAGSERIPEADNEQLEFLGDAVLGLVVTEHIVRACPDFDEGRLSNVKSNLVKRTHLAEVARKLRLGQHLLMGRGEESSGGREKTSLLADALEALLAAVYLDSGMAGARQVVLTHIVGDGDVRPLAAEAANNVKNSLEKLARARDLPRPEYSVRSENYSFPQMFVAEVRIGKDLHASGRGSSKKNAELEAARGMLAHFEQA